MSLISDIDDIADEIDDIADDIADEVDDIADDISEDVDDTVNNIFDNNSSPKIIISNADIGQEIVNENITFTFEDEGGTQTFAIERPQAEIKIFDSQYYMDSNPDVAGYINVKYEDSSVSVSLTEAVLPNINDTEFLTNYSSSIEHYVAYGAFEGRNPSPLFDTQYYLEQNPDVALALAGGDFSGDPLLHYVEVGASEGRNPNPYFDTDYYLAQNPGVIETGLNPLEHYVLYGSSLGADPSPNFDSNYYLSQNPDVLSAGFDPLTHFLVHGQIDILPSLKARDS